MGSRGDEPLTNTLQLCVALISAVLATTGLSEPNHVHHESHPMSFSDTGMVMNDNQHNLPWGCDRVSEDVEMVVRAGRLYAKDIPGMTFGMSRYEYRVKACARITVTFINEDDIRHQWMVHGLPKYLYRKGMFHLEAMAGRSISGTFIVPSENKTYLVHCDMAQHMEKGMKGQLVVGSGSGDLWGVSGQSDSFRRSTYLPGYTAKLSAAIIISTLALGLWAKKRSGS